MRIGKYILQFLFLINIFLFSGCYPSLKREAQRPDESLIPVKFFPPKFHDDMDLGSLAEAIERNLAYLDRLNPDQIFYYGPHEYTTRQVRDGQEALLEWIKTKPAPAEIGEKIRKEFLVYRAAGRVGNRKVLFTGYFEPVFEGRLKSDETFRYPIYRPPDDLVKIDLSLFNRRFKGQSIIARIDGNRVLPYYTRKQIELDHLLKGKDLEIAWLKDPLDVIFLQIQGSGRLRLPEGKMLSVGYGASNGHPYRSIGRYMLDKGYLTKGEMSMQGIREYLLKNPKVMDEVLSHNESYIFFRVVDNGPFGNINVPLTPGRSVALNDKLFPKGALGYISCRKPVVNSKGKITGWKDFSRFVLNQDTGGAIVGAGRADIFWGSGPYAEVVAGHLQHEGELYILIKKP